jgi:biotin-dependent carboxylase-like uncharacterized protein
MNGWSRPLALEVISTGLPILVQDDGRCGLAAVGVGRSGAADRASYARANALVANCAGAPALELTLANARLRVRGHLRLALTGAAAPITLDGQPVAHATAFTARHGQLLELSVPKTGLRSYLAVRGGIAVSAVLGSCSTDVLAGLGPAPLAAGDRVGVADVSLDAGSVASGPRASGAPESGPPAAGTFAAGPLAAGTLATDHVVVDPGEATRISSADLQLRVVLGPRHDWLASQEDLFTHTWTVSPDSDRVGIRLEGPALQRHPTLVGAELPSEGVVRGAIQVPSGGAPVLFGADHPVTGGYPVVAVLTEESADQAAQARPGQRVRFLR